VLCIDDSVKSTIVQLINTDANLQTQVTTLVAENDVLKANLTKLEAQQSTDSKSLCILFNAMCICDVQQSFLTAFISRCCVTVCLFLTIFV